MKPLSINSITYILKLTLFPDFFSLSSTHIPQLTLLPLQLSGHSDIDDTACSQQFSREIEHRHMGVNTDTMTIDSTSTKIKGGIFNKIQRSFKKMGSKKKSKDNIM